MEELIGYFRRDCILPMPGAKGGVRKRKGGRGSIQNSNLIRWQLEHPQLMGPFFIGIRMVGGGRDCKDSSLIFLLNITNTNHLFISKSWPNAIYHAVTQTGQTTEIFETR